MVDNQVLVLPCSCALYRKVVLWLSDFYCQAMPTIVVNITMTDGR